MYNQVRDLLADGDLKGQIEEEDLPLMGILTQVFQEFCLTGPMTLEEPPLEFELRRIDEEGVYKLWVLFPPSVTYLNFHQLSIIYKLGFPYVDAPKIIVDVEPACDPPRLALTVEMAMRRSRKILHTTQSLSVATTVDYHPASAGRASLPPSGLNVKKAAGGPTFSNTNNPRQAAPPVDTNKRQRSDSMSSIMPDPKRPRFDDEGKQSAPPIDTNKRHDPKRPRFEDEGKQ